MQSTFDAEIQYVTNSGDRTIHTMGPGSYRINGNNGAGQDRIRFRAIQSG
ncbi:colicin Z C-terminal domain-related protein [Providencia hangzhouensis]